jgi:hypothetical protein
MPRGKLDAHPSVVIVHCADLKKFLFNVYAEGYPRAAYRFSANNIGGNLEPGDRSPEDTLIREVSEEFDPNHGEEKRFVGEVVWAPDDDIRLIRNAILGGMWPLQDFMARQTGIISGGNNPYQAIYSAFYAPVSVAVIECAERNIRGSRNIPTEGLVGVSTLDDLTNHARGEFSTAHITAHVLNWHFGSRIPHPAQLSAEPIGMVRRSYIGYLSDFEYNSEALIRASEART